MTTAPLVSIIVPSYNQGRFLRQTLDSILAQDYRPLEVIVMDGASRDDSVAILAEYAARHPELTFRSEPDRGPADAVNKGLALARGVYAGIQSSDDYYLPGAVRDAVAVLTTDPRLGVACADAYHVDDEGRLLVRPRPERPFSLQRFLCRNMVVHQSSAFFRLDLARDLGGWNPRYFCCDSELWLRMSFRAGVEKVDRIWSARRIHMMQRDKERVRMFQDWNRMIDESAELKQAPLSVRLAARAGQRLIVIDYNPGLRWWTAVPLAWLGILTYPPSLLGIRRATALVPGLDRLRRRLQRRRLLPFLDVAV